MTTPYTALSEMGRRPALYGRTTTAALWTDPHISGRMLAHHLDPDVEAASHGHGFVDRAVTWMRGRFDLGPGSRLLDLGCGPGLYTVRLARHGVRATGVDFSPSSVEYAERVARGEGVPARHLCRDYLSLRLSERFDLAVMVMRDYCAMTPRDRLRLLDVVDRHLVSGGALLFDVDAEPALERVREDVEYAPGLMDGFWAAEPYHGFRHTFRYDRERVSLDRYDIVTASEVRVFHNWVRYFDPTSLASELARGGFVVEERYGDLTGAAYDPGADSFAVLARRG
ncbi:SAM-dependent methyltransferase [Nocardiopsis alba]|uniref:SAM-dependent methyltransferase n=1 Tax=Nocardiopsis alba TaxID=53437 RepID=UPI00366F964B